MKPHKNIRFNSEINGKGTVMKTTLSKAKKRLIELMQDIHFGRISTIQVRNGEPELTAESFIVRDIKMGGQNKPRAERNLEDFSLRKEVIELFNHMSRIGNGTINEVEIQNGLPFLVRIREQAA